MVLLENSKIIERITDELFSYISKLEETKYEFINVSNDYNKLKSLYDNINHNINKFIIVYGESNDNKRKYFKSIVNEIYDNKKNINTLYEEIKNAYLICIYNPNFNLQLNMFNDFMNKLSFKINSLSLMLDKNNLDNLEEKIQQLIDFSNIFYKNTFIDYCDTDLYINTIKLLDLTDEEKIYAIELGIKEFNRLYQVSDSYEIEEYNENNISIDVDDDINELFLDDDSVFIDDIEEYEVL